MQPLAGNSLQAPACSHTDHSTLSCALNCRATVLSTVCDDDCDSLRRRRYIGRVALRTSADEKRVVATLNYDNYEYSD
jgi:hypothetical protein